jgi:acyl-CoA thioester hydrolase
MDIVSAADLSKYAVEPGWSFGLPFVTRWSEVDPFGHASHRTHLVWCEEVRNAYFASLGHPIVGPDAAGPVLKEVGFTYEQPLAVGDEVLVTGRVAWVRRTSLQMEYAVWGRALAGRGHATCIWIVNATGERLRVPDALRCQMVERDSAKDLEASSE